MGFLDGGRKFHGLVTQDKFKLKTIRTFRDDEFIVTGDIKQFGKIDARFPLEKTADAMRYLSAGHAGGKVLINVQEL